MTYRIEVIHVDGGLREKQRGIEVFRLGENVEAVEEGIV